MARIQTPNPDVHLPFHLPLSHRTLLSVFFWLLYNTSRPLLAVIEDNK